MQTERGVVTQYAEGVNARGPESRFSLARAEGRERAYVYHCAPVPPGRGRHEYAERATRSSGCAFGGAERHPPASGQANVQSNNYWSATEYAPNTNNAWNFNFNNGNQNNDNKTNDLYAWAVQPGE